MVADFCQFKLDRILCEIRENLNDLTLPQIFTIQGTLNALVYSAALNDGVAYRGPDDSLHFNFQHLGYFFRTDRAVRTPVTFLADYLKKYWTGPGTLRQGCGALGSAADLREIQSFYPRGSHGGMAQSPEPTPQS